MSNKLSEYVYFRMVNGADAEDLVEDIVQQGIASDEDIAEAFIAATERMERVASATADEGQAMKRLTDEMMAE
jgi:hypothetical protein